MAKTFDQYLAESGRQSELDSLRRSGQYESAKSAYERTGGFGSTSGGGGSTGNLSSILNEATSMVRSQLEPITKQLESIRPIIAESFTKKKASLEGQLGSLGQRYQKLLSDITQRGQAQETSQTRVTNNELARRGITSDSTAASQELINSLKPIQDQTTSGIKDVQLAESDETRLLNEAISGLPNEQALAEADVLKQVAQILAGGVTQGLNLGSSIYTQNVANEQANRQTDAQRVFADLQNKLLEQQLSTAKQNAPIQLEQLKAELARLQRPSSSSGGGGINLSALSGLWG